MEAFQRVGCSRTRHSADGFKAWQLRRESSLTNKVFLKNIVKNKIFFIITA
jgi:hypothetical protein